MCILNETMVGSRSRMSMSIALGNDLNYLDSEICKSNYFG